MARPKLVRSSEFPYHVRCRANNREWFYLPKSEVWNILIKLLNLTLERYHCHLHSFVLMDNHFHLMISTPCGNLDKFMQYFIRESSKLIGLKSGRINRIFGGRYQRSLITEPTYFLNCYKYIFRNPVAANLCELPETYPYSTLRFTLGRGRSPLAISSEPENLFRHLPSNEETLLGWLNTPYHHGESEIIKNSLSRPICKWTKNKSAQKWVRNLENILIK